MAASLAVVSFSCTGPIIGTLLVDAATKGDRLGPAIGMLGFSFALAIPFVLFAMFPSRLKSMPKSGGWLNSVKVVLGFLELALALKFLSNVDLAYNWQFLDREVFLALWIVIFALMGLYLIGKIKFAHDSDLKFLSVPRTVIAILVFSFVVYMVPGMWGAPLKSIAAFLPPIGRRISIFPQAYPAVPRHLRTQQVVAISATFMIERRLKAWTLITTTTKHLQLPKSKVSHCWLISQVGIVSIAEKWRRMYGLTRESKK